MSDFETWWHNEGSYAPNKDDDCESHCKKMCEIAWANGAYKARQEFEKQLTELQEQLKTARKHTCVYDDGVCKKCMEVRDDY